MINRGDIVYVRGTDWASRFIMKVTKGKYSHVAIYIGDGEVFEAQGFRLVGKANLSDYDGEYDTLPLPNSVSGSQREMGLGWLSHQEGRGYSWWSDFVIFVRCVAHVAIPWHEDKNIMCARLARDYLAECGLPIQDADMSPEEVYDWQVTELTK